jgi:hypothetical protein
MVDSNTSVHIGRKVLIVGNIFGRVLFPSLLRLSRRRPFPATAAQ